MTAAVVVLVLMTNPLPGLPCETFHDVLLAQCGRAPTFNP
jgi:hypothetical protein